MSLIAHPTSGLLLVGSAAQGGSGLLAVSQDCCCDHGDQIDGCCDLDDVLTGTLSNKQGAAAAMPDTVTLTQAGLTFQWNSNSFAGPCAPHGAVGFSMACDIMTGLWTVIGAGGMPTLSVTVIAANCTTQHFVFDVTFDDGAGCLGSFTLTVDN